jgi:hypothetical protein
VANSSDCDDSSTSINPLAAETCNGIDDNCNGQIDEDVSTTFYLDADGDGYGDPNIPLSACVQQTGYVENSQDCDDSSTSINPLAAETCNSIDDNCNGQMDEGFDSDGDGFTSCGGDCNDSNSSINPGAAEVCNGIDDNCNGQMDEGVTTTFYRDADGDGYGDPLNSTEACTLPSGYVANSSDCDDSSTSINPLAAETCNGIDDNCNGQILQRADG